MKQVISTEQIPIKMCKCGCGTEIGNVGFYGRERRFVSGHNGRKYKDRKQYQREWKQRNKQTLYEAKIKRGHRLKAKVIRIVGSECKDCGLEYNGKMLVCFSFIIKTQTRNCL